MVHRTRVLVVDDDPGIRNLLREYLAPRAHEVMTAENGQTALSIAREWIPDAVVLDLDLPDIRGLEVLERLKAGNPLLPVVILTGRGDIPSAVEATELGAFAFLTKSADMGEIGVVLQRALEQRSLRLEIESLRERLDCGHELAVRMGPGRLVQALVERVRRVAASDITVLLQGETGTGKELVARALHQCSARREAPFIALDCGSIPEALIESQLFGHEKGAFTGAAEKHAGYFQAAQGGTLFLDELANLPLPLQARLLRVLQERQLQPVGSSQPVALDVRIVAATNAELREDVAKGRFRQDLYFRLAEFTIQVPPLRERIEDIGYLATRFAEEASIELRRAARTLTASAIERLEQHEWPGNVRELRNVVRRAVLASEELCVSAAHVRHALESSEVLPQVVLQPKSVGEPALAPALSLREIGGRAAQEAERSAIGAALVAARGNKSEAARQLKTDPKTLHLKIRQYGLR